MSICSNEMVIHSERCSECIQLQELIDFLEQQNKNCDSNKHFSRYNISECDICAWRKTQIDKIYDLMSKCFWESIC